MSDDDNGTAENQQADSGPGISGTQSKPGNRLKNPLGDLSSFTYQISLYMITADAYDAFVASGRRRINALNEASGVSDSGGAYLIAQSGGINNKFENRAPGFDFDFAIDNLSYKTLISSKATLTSSNNSTFKFDVVEPYGFSFITKLKQAADALGQYNTQLGYPKNPIRQFFILGIRFFGYDVNGELNNIEGIYQSFYDIAISKLRFNLDGASTVYNIEAASLSPSVGFGVRRGTIKNSKTVEARTVGTALEKLFATLNKEQSDLLENNIIEKPNKYRIVYLGDGAREIEVASLLSEEYDTDKFRASGSGARTTSQSNPSAEVLSNFDPTKRKFTFREDSTILDIINTFIVQSDYLTNALNAVFVAQEQPNPNTGNTPPPDPNVKATIKWYNCSAEISDAEWDRTISDWAYTITYIIQTYETPVTQSVFAKSRSRYYGPFKRYEYYFTGKNSEVLSYTQSFDNTYFNVALDPSNRPLSDIQNSNSNSHDIPIDPGQRTAQPRLGRRGAGLEAQNSYVTSLYDPGAYATAKLSILGDPDFLMRETPDSLNQVYDKFYQTNGLTVNPNGGQVFIEVDFKEAIDYTTDTGTLKINESILFFPYPKEIAKLVKGVSYTVRDVTSKFSGGKFTQDLTVDINTFGSDSTQDDTESADTSGQIQSNLVVEKNTTASGAIDDRNPPIPPPGGSRSSDDDDSGD